MHHSLKKDKKKNQLLIICCIQALVPFAALAETGAQQFSSNKHEQPHDLNRKLCGSTNSNVEVPGHVTDELIVKFRPELAAAERANLHATMNATVDSRIEKLGIELVRLHGTSAQQALCNYLRNPNVEYAELNFNTHIAFTPTDPEYTAGNQWGLDKVMMPEAWNLVSRKTYDTDSQVVVAVVDSGVDHTHSDLSYKVIRGHDYIDGDNYPYDENGHGTHVAGIISANHNNNWGIAGTAPNNNTLIYASRVFDSEGNGSSYDMAQAIMEAADFGAKVINISGGTSSSSGTLKAAVDYAWNSGSIIVAASGNNNTDDKFYPASYSNVISVASSNGIDRISSFSNYGTTVDVAAPGENILSTVPGENYALRNGTSMATPFVAGIATILARQGRSNVGIANAILNTTDPLDPAETKQILKGRINALNAIQYGYPTLIIDNSDTSRTSSSAYSGWANSSYGYEHENENYAFAHATYWGESSFTWNFQTDMGTNPGYYRVFVKFTDLETNYSAAKYTVHHDNSHSNPYSMSSTITVDQSSSTGLGGEWISLGDFYFNGNSYNKVVLSENTYDTTKTLVADAIKLKKVYYVE